MITNINCCSLVLEKLSNFLSEDKLFLETFVSSNRGAINEDVTLR